MPKDKFDALVNWIPEIDKYVIKIEFNNFASSFKKLQPRIYPEKLYNEEMFICENTDEEDSVVNSKNNSELIPKNHKKKFLQYKY